MSETQWYAATRGQQHGPMSEADLKQMLANGQLGPADLVWQPALPQWVAASSIAGLLPAGGTLPPPLGAPVPPTAALYYAQPVNAPAGPDIGQNAGMRMLLPVGRSGWAIAAGYLGLLSFIILPAPLALIISIVAIIDIKKHPDRHGMGRAIFGLVMGVIGTLLLIVWIASFALSR